MENPTALPERKMVPQRLDGVSKAFEYVIFNELTGCTSFLIKGPILQSATHWPQASKTSSAHP